MDQKEAFLQLSESIEKLGTNMSAKLDDLSKMVSQLDKQQAIQGKDIDFIKQEDAKQNKLLDEHIEGVKQVREQNQLMKDSLLAAFQQKASELEERIKKLEGPRQWLKQTIWLLITSGAIAYAVTHLSDLIRLLSK